MVDRFLLIRLFLVSYLHPIFVPLFLALCFTMIGQISIPVAWYAWGGQLVPLILLILFTGFLLLKCLMRNIHCRVFLVVAFATVGSFYFVAVMTKVSLDKNIFAWVLYNQLQNLFIGAYVHGWVSFLTEAQAVKIAAIIEVITKPLLIGTFFLELSGVILLAHRRLCLIILSVFMVFHITVFLVSGIFFWELLLVDLGLFIFVKSQSADQKRVIFNKKNLIVCAIIIMTLSKVCFRTVGLGWFDTKLYNIYKFDAVTKSGEVYRIDEDMIAPYDNYFGHNIFHFLHDNKVFDSIYGSVGNLPNARLVNEHVNRNNVVSLQKAYGRYYFSREKTDVFIEFIRKYFQNVKKHQKRKIIFLQHFKAPYHFYYFENIDRSMPWEEIQTINIRRIEKYFNGKNIETFRDYVIHSIEL